MAQAQEYLSTVNGKMQEYITQIDKNKREMYRDGPYYQRTVEFTSKYDEVSFEADYPNEPLSTFEPMVRRVLTKDWSPPSG